MLIVVILLVVAAAAGGWWWMSQRDSDDGPAVNAGSATPVVDPNAGSKRNWLEGVGGAVQGRHFHVGERTVTLGRKPQNFVQITDTQASRTHLNLRPMPDGMQLTDMNSKHGTYVNGSLVKSAILKDGDEIRIGAARLVYRREAQFETDDARKAKAIDSAMTGETSADFASMARKTLHECGGDLNLAAQRLGLPPEMLRNVLNSPGSGR